MINIKPPEIIKNILSDSDFDFLKNHIINKDIKNIKISLTSDDFTKPCNMKTVFISASPVLVNEVSRFY